MSDSRSFTKVADVGTVIAVVCTPDGKLVGVNDITGQVWFYALDSDDPDREPLPLRLSTADATGVLLHPDGRVISYRCDSQLRIRIHDPRTGKLLREHLFGPLDSDQYEYEDEYGDDEYQRPSVEDGFYFDVAILQRPPLLDWLQPLELANPERNTPNDWMSTLPDRLRYADMYPDRATRLALHPNQRWLAVLDRATWIIDLDTGELVNTLGHAIEIAEMVRYGEGTHTIGFDQRGLIKIASVAISGNPFLQVDRIDFESGEHESTTENWRQIWGPAEAADIEVHRYDPTTHLPPERIPEHAYKVFFRRWGIELWARDGLQRGVFLPASVCVIPSFDPGSYCSEPRVLLVSNDSLELLDIVTGERSPRRPPIEPLQTTTLTHIGFDPSHRRVLLWREHAALLAGPIDEDRWGVCELPEGRRMREWAFASERGRAFVIDEDGGLWLGDLDPEPAPSPRERPSLQPLVRELLARPHDPAPFLVYADALIERGDPHGELIMLQHQAAVAEAQALIERNVEALLGPLVELDPASFELSWQRGYVRAAKFNITYDRLGPLLAFLASDHGRLLESLELHLLARSEADHVIEVYQHIDAYLAAARHLPQLRSLELGRAGEHPLSAKLLAALPQLTA